MNVSATVSDVVSVVVAVAGRRDIQPTEYVRWHSEHGHDSKAVGRGDW